MSPETIRSLNQLLALHSRSFPSYLRWARPYVPAGREEAMQAINDVAAGQDDIVQRVTRMLNDAEALTRSGEYPMEYTDVHDLEIGYLLRMACAYQQQDIAALEGLVEKLQLAPAARTLAEEALGMARGHLETLTEAAAAAAS
jgi:hypothetical protein